MYVHYRFACLPTEDRPIATRRTRPSSTRLLVPVIALVAVAGLALAGLGGDDDPQPRPSVGPSPSASGDPQSGSPPEADLSGVVRRQEGDPLARGDVDAPVVMVEWADFQCPFCGRFARDTEPELVERFVEEGTLRIEWRDFPYLGPESDLAARAGRAAARQEAFWPFHDGLYAEAREVNSGVIDQAWLEAMAEELGLDVEQFRRDMASDEVAAEVAADRQLGQSLGVTGTPAFLVNGRPIMGAQPTEVFVEAIEQAAEDAA